MLVDYYVDLHILPDRNTRDFINDELEYCAVRRNYDSGIGLVRNQTKEVVRGAQSSSWYNGFAASVEAQPSHFRTSRGAWRILCFER